MVIAAVQVFFLLLLNFAAHPVRDSFKDALPPDGSGLNPLLQYPEMVIHPPCSIWDTSDSRFPSRFALGALIMTLPRRKVDPHHSPLDDGDLGLPHDRSFPRRALGATAVLGWGGYWGWDPVENASLMPWLTGTAFCTQ